MFNSLLVVLFFADALLLVVRSDSNCQQKVPIQLDDGLEGYCCIYNRNRPSVRVEEIVRYLNLTNKDKSATNRMLKDQHRESESTENPYSSSNYNNYTRNNERNRKPYKNSSRMNVDTNNYNNNNYNNNYSNLTTEREFSSNSKKMSNVPIVFPGQNNANRVYSVKNTTTIVKMDRNNSTPVVTTIDSNGNRRNFTFGSKNSINVPHNCPEGKGANENGDCVDSF